MRGEDARARLRILRDVQAHSLKVARIASALARAAERNGRTVDLRVVRAGALLHDIGRSETHSISHGIAGARMLREAGFPEAVARIAETHCAFGLTRTDAKRSGLPPGDYVPRTLEERVVCVADKLSGPGKIARVLAHFPANGTAARRKAALFASVEEACGNAAWARMLARCGTGKPRPGTSGNGSPL